MATAGCPGRVVRRSREDLPQSKIRRWRLERQFLEMPTLSKMRGVGSRHACKFTQDLKRQLLEMPTLSTMRGRGSRNARKFK